MTIHENKEQCEKCNMKKKSLHKELIVWFDALHKEMPDVHISWAFRGETDQNIAFKDGKSEVKWPNSKHNVHPSRAMDLFSIDSKGKAVFDEAMYGRIAAKLLDWNAPINWGGDFKRKKDYCHFELNGSVV